jgi:outer membrane lipoprotein LolB
MLTKYISVVSLCLFIVGCATPPPTNVKIDSVRHQQQLAELQRWQIKGRFGFKSPEQKPQSASLSWLQNHEDYQLALSTILGTSILTLQGNPQWVTLNADDETYSGTNASELIKQITGWTLPVEQLPTWIKGQSLKSDKVTLSQQGWIAELRPSCLNCRGWLIRYADYQTVENKWLPHKIKLSHEKNNVEVTIKVNSWTIN